jgi:hypothetical protein
MPETETETETEREWQQTMCPRDVSGVSLFQEVFMRPIWLLVALLLVDTACSDSAADPVEVTGTTTAATMGIPYTVDSGSKLDVYTPVSRDRGPQWSSCTDLPRVDSPLRPLPRPSLLKGRWFSTSTWRCPSRSGQLLRKWPALSASRGQWQLITAEMKPGSL